MRALPTVYPDPVLCYRKVLHSKTTLPYSVLCVKLEDKFLKKFRNNKERVSDILENDK